MCRGLLNRTRQINKRPTLAGLVGFNQMMVTSLNACLNKLCYDFELTFEINALCSFVLCPVASFNALLNDPSWMTCATGDRYFLPVHF
jgi:hypothetical protein